MKRGLVILLTTCIAATLFACTDGRNTESSEASLSSVSSNEIQHDTIEPQFNQSVTCSSLSIGDGKPDTLDIIVTGATVLGDIHSLPSENYTDDIVSQISGWDSLPASLLSLDGSAEIHFLCVTQTVTNTSEKEVEFYVNSNRVIALDNSNGEELSDAGMFTTDPIYIDAGGKNDLTETADGVRQHMFRISLAAGESVDVTVGYAVSESLLQHPLMYVINPFGREDSAAGRLVLGYVE